MGGRLRIIAVGTVLVLVALPLGSDRLFNPYYLDLAARIIITWIALLGFALLAGYTGMVSFGHAAFFGLGAYSAAWSLLYLAPVLPLSLIAGVAAATIAALVIGYLCIRTQGVYFILLTLAFAELGYQVVFNGGSITGGRNGLFSVPKGNINISGLIVLDWRDPTQAYYLALFAFGIAYAVARWIANSPFGATMVAVRDNADRAAYLGYDVAAIKRRSFTISAVFAGFGGALWAHHQSYVSPELLHWSLSGQFIIMTWLGGVGTLIGPIIGGALLMGLADILSSIMKNWLVFVGALYIAVVLWAPQGLWGIIVRLFQKKGP
jgi:branched-chain amino acid transport system permease protein